MARLTRAFSTASEPQTKHFELKTRTRQRFIGHVASQRQFVGFSTSRCFQGCNAQGISLKSARETCPDGKNGQTSSFKQLQQFGIDVICRAGAPCALYV